MTDLHDPAPRVGVRMHVALTLLLAAAADMRLVAVLPSLSPADVVVIALVGAQMLQRLRRGLRALHDHGLQRLGQQPHVIAVRWGDHDGDRDPAALGQDAALGPPFATVRGIGPRRLPPNGALVIAPSMLCQVHSSPAKSS